MDGDGVCKNVGVLADEESNERTSTISELIEDEGK